MNGLFISGITHLVFLDHGSPWVTDTRESETVEKGELLYHPVSPPTKKKASFSLFISHPTPPLQATSSFSQTTKKEQDKILQHSLKRPKIKRAYFSNQKGQRDHKQ